MSRPNAFDPQAKGEYDERDPEGYRCAELPFGKAAGGKELAVRLFEMQPGQALCPYHYEYVEEWLMVVSGQVQVRTPAGTEPAQAGDLVCFPAGPEGAHKVTNDTDQPVRIIMFSGTQEPSVAVYPDNGTVGVWTGNDRDKWRFRDAEAHLDYFDGEPPRA